MTASRKTLPAAMHPPPQSHVIVTRLSRVDFVHPGVNVGDRMTRHDTILATEDKPIELRQGLIHFGDDIYPLAMVARMQALKPVNGS